MNLGNVSLVAIQVALQGIQFLHAECFNVFLVSLLMLLEVIRKRVQHLCRLYLHP